MLRTLTVRTKHCCHATQSLSEILAEAEISEDAGIRFDDICEELRLTVALEYDSDSDNSDNVYKYHCVTWATSDFNRLLAALPRFD